MRIALVSQLKRQRTWVFVITEVTFTVLLAIARLLSPVPPQPLGFVVYFWLAGVVITAVIIQTAYARSFRLAAELERTNASLHTEIAERKRVEEELRGEEKRYHDLFENANDAIVIFTLEGTVTSVNRGLEVMLGWSQEELIGQHYRKFVTPASVALGEERTRRFLAGERVGSIFEAEQVRKDGSVVPVEVRTRAIRDLAGRPLGFQGIYRDISARKALERRHTDFLAMVTHDIRNPLGVILGYTEMLREKAIEQQSHWEEDILSRIETSALTVHSLVTNYLDLSKIEAGQLTLAKQSVAINDVLSRVGRQYERESRRRRLTLELRLQEELPLIEGDPAALERVFANLVHNGLKFTPQQGQVTITSAQRNGEVRATISDTGSGMVAAEIPGLFEKYRQAKHAKQVQGTGLGLFIVKTLVEAHDGRIEVQSTPGVGSCFSVFLPVTASAARQEG